MFLTWKILLYAIPALSLSALVLVVNNWREKASQLDGVRKELSDYQDKCAKDKATTKEADDAFAKNHSYTDDQCIAALSLPATCVSVQSSRRTKLAGPQHGHEQADGLEIGWLKIYGDECEAIRKDYNTAVEFGHRCAQE